MVQPRVSGRNLAYLCPFCSLRQPLIFIAVRQVSRSHTIHTGHESLSRRLASLERQFTTSSTNRAHVDEIGYRSFAIEDTLSSTNVQTKQRVRSNPNSSVRDKLRRWTIDNASKVTTEAISSSMTRGQTIGFPNSMFLDQNEQEEDDTDDVDTMELGDEDSMPGGSSLTHGDLFRIRISGEKTQFAVVVGNVGTQTQYLLQNGSWYMTEKTRFSSIQIKNFATANELEQLRAFLPRILLNTAPSPNSPSRNLPSKGSVPLDICRSLISRMTNIDEDANNFHRRNLSRFKQIYTQISDPTMWMVYDLEELVWKIFETEFRDMSPGEQIKIFENLKSEHECIRIRQAHGSIKVMVFPQSLARNIERVTSWAREYQEAAAQAASGYDVSLRLRDIPLAAFITKARRLILTSRKIRSPTVIGCLSPSKIASSDIQIRHSDEDFTDADRSIIDFLWNTYVRHPHAPSAASAQSSAVGALILRAVGAYPGLALDKKVGKLLLQELGCLDPWLDPATQAVTSTFSATSLLKSCAESKRTEQAALAGLDFRNESKLIPFSDSLSHIRKDWGSLKAFCIDGQHTQVADDAVSIEKSAEMPDHFWIRAHIAHPSAFVPFGHAFEQRARYMGSSYYSLFGSEASMPKELTQTLSVNSNVPVLTCSSLIGPDGSTVKIIVEPGVVRNVIKLTSEAVNEIMGSSQSQWTAFTVGNTFSSSESRAGGVSHAEMLASVKEHVEELSLLREILNRRWAAREVETPERLTLRQGARYWSSVRTSRDWLNLRHDRLFESHHHEGDPSIEIRTTRAPDLEGSSENLSKRDIVASTMVLASESFARWTFERNIPTAYLGHLLAPGFSISKLNNLGPNEAFVPPTLAMSTKPSPFLTLSCRHYGRFTSPLRRYTDLLNAYQIDHYLKMQASGAVTPGQAVDSDLGFPYTKNELDFHLRNDRASQDSMSEQNLSKTHWKFQALFRAFHFKQAKLPDAWDFEVTNPIKVAGRKSVQGEINGILSPLGVTAKTVASSEGFENNAKFRQFLPVKIDMVDPENRVVVCRAIGPATNKPQYELDFEYWQREST